MEAEIIKLNKKHYAAFIFCVVLSVVAVSAASNMTNNEGENSGTHYNVSNQEEYSSNVLKLGDSGKKVVSLQKILSTYGYYFGEINGKFDKSTEKAVKNLQADSGLESDGIVGEETNDVLRHLNTLLNSDDGGKIGNSNGTEANVSITEFNQE